MFLSPMSVLGGLCKGGEFSGPTFNLILWADKGAAVVDIDDTNLDLSRPLIILVFGLLPGSKDCSSESLISDFGELDFATF